MHLITICSAANNEETFMARIFEMETAGRVRFHYGTIASLFYLADRYIRVCVFIFEVRAVGSHEEMGESFGIWAPLSLPLQPYTYNVILELYKRRESDYIISHTHAAKEILELRKWRGAPLISMADSFAIACDICLLITTQNALFHLCRTQNKQITQ